MKNFERWMPANDGNSCPGRGTHHYISNGRGGMYCSKCPFGERQPWQSVTGVHAPAVVNINGARRRVPLRAPWSVGSVVARERRLGGRACYGQRRLDLQALQEVRLL